MGMSLTGPVEVCGGYGGQPVQVAFASGYGPVYVEVQQTEAQRFDLFCAAALQGYLAAGLNSEDATERAVSAALAQMEAIRRVGDVTKALTNDRKTGTDASR